MKVITNELLKKFFNKSSDIFAKKTDIKSVNINNNLTTTTAGSALDAVQGKALDNKITDLKKSVSDGKSAIASAITAKGVSTASDASFDTMASNIGNLSSGTVKIDNKIITENLTLSTIRFSNGAVAIPSTSGRTKYIRSPQSVVSKSDNYDGCYINDDGTIYERKKNFSLSYITRTSLHVFSSDFTRYKGEWFCIGNNGTNIINITRNQTITADNVYSLYSYKDHLYVLTYDGLCEYNGSSLDLLSSFTTYLGELIEWNGYIYFFVLSSSSSNTKSIQRYDPSTGSIGIINNCPSNSKFFIISNSLYYGYRYNYKNYMYSVHRSDSYNVSSQENLLDGTYWNDGFITYNKFYPMNSTMYIKN